MKKFQSVNKFCNQLVSQESNEQFMQILSQYYLKSANIKPNSQKASNARISYGLSSVQGWRLYQEDDHIAIIEVNNQNNLSLFAVMDGHNGPEVAKYAAKHLPQYISENKYFKEGNICNGLEDAFLSFDQSLLSTKAIKKMQKYRKQITNKHCDSHRPGFNSGSTCVLAMIRDNTIFVANIGDSRCVLSRKGKAIALTSDHKPELMSEKRRIENAGGFVFNDRINHMINVSRAFGDHQFKANRKLSDKQQMITAFPDVTQYEINANKDEFIVLACDGIYNSMKDQRVIDFVRKRIKSGIGLSTICEQLIHCCISPVIPIDGRVGGDNMTCIIVKFNNTT